MKFNPDGPSIPDILLERCDAGRVVFLCGAGVSLPSGMPTFVGLTRYVIDFFDPPAESDIMAAFRPWLDGQSAANVPLDQIFNLLHLEYGKDEVNALVTERLSAPLETKDFGREHGLIKRISSSQSGVPQTVELHRTVPNETWHRVVVAELAGTGGTIVNTLVISTLSAIPALKAFALIVVLWFKGMAAVYCAELAVTALLFSV